MTKMDTSSNEHGVPTNQADKLHQLMTAVLIDDAFDSLSADADAENRLHALWDAVRSSPQEQDLIVELAAHGCLDDARERILPTAFDALYPANLEISNDLRDLVEQHLFVVVRQKRRQIEEILEALKSQGFSIMTVGSHDELPQPPPDIVFLDFYLGLSDDATARRQAVARLKELEAVYATGVPFVVLMSGASLGLEEREMLRHEAGWVAGLFDFAPKADLSTPGSVRLRKTLWEMALPNRKHIYAFVHALKKSVESVSASFMSSIYSLGLEDYAFVQRFHLNADGQPLGEYMLWLFGSLLPHLAFDNDRGVAATREQLDKVRFENLLPGTLRPSLALADCYGLAISTPAVGPIDVHPLHHAVLSSAGLPYLQTGDLLCGSTNEVWLVTSPACDIAFAPGSDRDKPGRVVILVPGELKEITPNSAPVGEDEVVTRLFPRGNRPHRIHWNPKAPQYVMLGAFEAWRSERSLNRVARLHIPYVLEVQQAFARNLTRIGMPVPPPMPFNASTQVLWRRSDGRAAEAGGVVVGGARVFLLRGETRFQLRIDALEPVIRLLPDLRATLQAEADQLQAGQKRDAALERLSIVDRLLSRPEEWAAIASQDFPMPSGAAEAKVIDKLLFVGFDRNIEPGAQLKPYIYINVQRSS